MGHSEASNRFKKGQKATRIFSYDGKGTFAYQQAIVYSCGKKRMILIDAKNGEVLGRHFSPDGKDAPYQITLEEMSEEQAKHTALKMAREYVTNRRTELERLQLSRLNDINYTPMINQLHEPRAETAETLRDEVRRKHDAKRKARK